MCTLQFNVDGEFITDLSREWFYVEGKGYDKCMDLLESSMYGTDETKEQIIRHAEDLLLGRAALKGNTGDGTYHLEIYPPENEEKMPEDMNVWQYFLLFHRLHDTPVIFLFFDKDPVLHPILPEASENW